MTKTHYELEIRTVHENSVGLWHLFDRGTMEYLRKHYDIYTGSPSYEARMFKVDVTRIRTDVVIAENA